MSLSLKARTNKQGHGRFIWLFANIRTNQVLYSLDKYPDENKMLKQLTFYGKQTQASHIRKDLWQPFAAITFPNPQFGFTAFQRLREYRKLRDYTWTFKPTAEDIEKAREEFEETAKFPKLDSRLPDKKERAKLLMDQKASAIADLADVLRRENIRLQQKAAEDAVKEKKRKEKSDYHWKQITDLAARAREGELAKYEGWITRMEEDIESSGTERSKARKKKGLMMLKIKRNELLRAKEALDFIEGKEEVALIQRLKWNQNLRDLVQERTEKIVDFQNPPKAPKPSLEAYPLKQKSTADRRPWYSDENPAPTHLHPSNTMIDPSAEPFPLKARDLPLNSVLIQWRSLHDAAYAEEWPGIVFHEQVEKDLIYQKDPFWKQAQASVGGEEEVKATEVETPAEEAKVEEEKSKSKGFFGTFRDTVRAPFGSSKSA